jgi:hypothetical protein
MSIVMKRAFVEITLLKKIFATSISAVGVATAPGDDLSLDRPDP